MVARGSAGATGRGTAWANAVPAADSVDKSAVQAHVKGYADKGVISRFAIPDRILFVEALDKTSVGKIDKKALRAKYGDG